MEYKVFIGLEEIAGHYSGLKKGFQDIGVECVFINLSTHPFNYGGDDEPNALISLYKNILKKKDKSTSKAIKVLLFGLLFCLKLQIFIWAILNYNVFIFAFGNSFFNLYDLKILKLLNKKLIFAFSGSDGRPPYIAIPGNSQSIEDMYHSSCKKKAKISKIEQFADVIITHPAYAHFHEKRYIKYLLIGIPFLPLQEIKPKKSRTNNSVRILHSPSNPVPKGSDRIRAAIAEMHKRGYDIEYIEITGKSHKIVIEEIQECDFVVDQVYSDTPMATFATEAAWYGKPSIVCGYYSRYIQEDYAPDVIPPSIFCHPDEICGAIEKLIVDENYRKELGEKAQYYVHARWTPEQVAKRYLQIIKGDIPEDWFSVPNDIRYLQGAGISEYHSKEIISNLIKSYGVGSLCLSDKPELEALFEQYGMH